MVVVQRKKTKQHLYIVMAISFIIASVLSVYPLSAEIALFRPMWMIMMLIFWLIFQPTLIGMGLAFTPIVLELGVAACGSLSADLSIWVNFSAFIYPRGVCTPITLYRCHQYLNLATVSRCHAALYAISVLRSYYVSI